MAMTGVPLTHGPYRGSNPALTDMLSGRGPGDVRQHAWSILAVHQKPTRGVRYEPTDRRSDALPDAPTVGDTVKGHEASAWFGMGVPAKTLPEVIATLNKAINEVLGDPKMKVRLALNRAAPRWAARLEDFGKIVAAETEKWKRAVEAPARPSRGQADDGWSPGAAERNAPAVSILTRPEARLADEPAGGRREAVDMFFEAGGGVVAAFGHWELPKADQLVRNRLAVERRDELLVQCGQDRVGDSFRADHENPNVEAG